MNKLFFNQTAVNAILIIMLSLITNIFTAQLWANSKSNQTKKCWKGYLGIPYFSYYIGPGINLSKAKLRGRNLQNVCLQAADLRKASLWRANLFGTKLERANLRGASLGRADLRGADLRKARLCSNVLRVYPKT